MTARMTQLVEGQAEAAAQVNENFRAVEPASCYGYCAETSNLLTFGYYGGTAYVNDDYVTIADGTLSLTNSATNYIEANNTTGAVSSNTSGFTDGYLRLYEVVTAGGVMTNITDKRFNYGIFAASVVALPEFMGALVSLSGDLTAQNYSAGGQVPFGAEQYDTHGFHSTSANTSRLTVPSGLGITKVVLGFQIKLSLVTAGTSYIATVIKNGVATIAVGQPQVYVSDGMGTDPSIAVTSLPIAVSAGDYFEVRLALTDASVTIASSGTYFGMWVAEATRLDQHRSALSTISSSAGTLTINLSAYEYFKTTLTENVTTVTMSGVTAGVLNRFELQITQDGTTSRTWANPASWVFLNQPAYTVSPELGAVDIIKGRTYDGGTTWYIEYWKQTRNDGKLTKTMADANQTLTAVEARNGILEATGALTALRNLVVPVTTARQWTVYANTSGGFGVQVIGATGTGITVGDGKRAIVYADGTNVVRVTADT